MSDKKITKTLNKVINTINNSDLNIKELILLYGNLGYYLGASIAGFSETGPNLDELKKEYYLNPTVDVGLMIQGLIITDWEKDFSEKPQLSKFALTNKKKG